MKVGIFTITDALNYGAFYQMFGLYKHLEDQGHDVVLYTGNESFSRLAVKYFSPNPSRLIRKTRMRKLFKRNERDLVIKKYKGEKIDIAVLGSDEIWNLDNSSFEHHDHFFGIGINAKKIVSYAPSVGFCSTKTFTGSKVTRNLANIDYCLVRDNRTEQLSKLVNASRVKQVVDPTILYNNWEKHIPENRYTEPYFLYYGYSTNPEFKNNLISRSKESGIKIISAGYNVHDWCNSNINVTPFEFLSLIKGSKAFYTSTFHGTVMASIIRHPFTVSTKSQKVIDFISKFSLESNIHNMESDYKISGISDNSFKKIIESSDVSRKLLNSALSS
jgi:hypothetical protein